MINKLKELLEAATPGPWNVDGCGEIYTTDTTPRHRRLVHVDLEATDEDPQGIGSTSYWQDGNPNAALIVAMRNCLPELLAVVEAAESLNEGAEYLGYGQGSKIDYTYKQDLDSALAALAKKVGE